MMLPGAPAFIGGAAPAPGAAFPVIEGFNTDADGSSSSSTITVPMPAGVVSGELLTIELNGWRAAGNTPGFTTPSGWTQRFNNTYGASNSGRLAIYDKISNGTETTVNVSTDSSLITWASVSRRISGAGAIHVGSIGTGSSVNPSSPSFNPGIGANDFLWFSLFGAGSDAGSTTSVSSGPVDYEAPRSDAGTNGASRNNIIGSAHRPLTAASEDPGQWTIANSRNWGAVTYAIAPA